MGERRATKLQGFLVTDQRISTDTLAALGAGATDSSYTRAGARPGTATPSDDRTSIYPRIHGAQDNDLDAQMVVGGVPAGVRDGAAVAYRVDGEADASMRGWAEPNSITYYAPIFTTAGPGWDLVASRTIPSTQKVVAVGWDRTDTHPPSSWTWSPTTRTWGSRVSIEAATSPDNLSVALVVHPRTERVYAIIAGEDSGVRTYFSDDSGATWTKLAADALIDSTGVTVDIFAAAEHITAEYDGLGNILLLAVDGGTGDWWTYVSRDDCVTFVELSSGDGLLGPTSNLHRLPSGALLLTYMKQSDDFAYGQVLASAYTIPSDNLDILIGEGDIEFLNAEIDGIVSCVDWDGTAYAVLAMDSLGAAGGDKWKVCRSMDQGASWQPYARNGFTQYAHAQDDVLAPEAHELRALAPSGGELVCIFAPPTDYLYSCCLGGWSSIEPGLVAGRRIERPGTGTALLAPLSMVFFPSEILDTQDWAHTGAAAAITAGYHRYAPAAAQSYDTYSPGPISLGSDDEEQCFALQYEVFVVTGSTADDRACVRIRASDGVSDDKHVSIRHSTTGYIVRDMHAGTTLATVSVALTSPTQIAIFISSAETGNLMVFHKAPSSSVWTLGFDGSLSDTGGTGPSAIDVGTVTSSSPDFSIGSIRWSCEGVWSRDLTDSSAITDSPIPHGLKWGKGLSGYPYPVRDRGDSTRMMRISLAGGAGRIGETFAIPAIFDYGVDKALPMVSPSPRSGWRTTQTASDEALVFDITGAAVNTHFDHSRSFAMFVAGLHTPQNIVLERRATAAGAWTTVGTYNGATGFESLSYTLNGDTLVSNGVPAGDRYCWENEWVGGYVIVDIGGTPVARTILSNTSGYWTSGSDVPKMELRLGGITGTEATTGTCTIVHPSGVLVVPGASATYFRRLRIRIPGGQVVPDAYYHLGVVAVGGLLVPGQQIARGWTMRHEPRNEETEDDYGTIWSTKHGPIRREFTWSYQDGASLYAVRNGTSPDYVQMHSSGHVEAAYGDVIGKLAGLMQAAKGGAVPVVGLLRLPENASVVTYTDPTLMVYGRLRGSPQYSNVVGSPGFGEFGRSEPLTLTELPWDND